MRQRSSIGKKLGKGFAALILLMAISAVTAYLKQREMNQTVRHLQEELFPTAAACAQVESSINGSLAALRGYLILGKDKTAGKEFIDQRAEAWRDLDLAKGKLTAFSKNWTDQQDLANLRIIEENIGALREAQQKVEDEAHAADNVPALELLLTEAVPCSDRMVEAITKIIDEEANLVPTPERRKLLKSMADIRGSFAMSLTDIRAFLLSGEPEYRIQFDRNWLINNEAVKQADSITSLLSGTQNTAWKLFTTLREEFAPLPGRMFTLRSGEDWNRAYYHLGKEAAPRAAQMIAALGEIQTSLKDTQLENAREKVEANMRAVTLTLFGVTVIGIVLGIGVATVTSRNIVKAISEVVDRARLIGDGDLTGEPIKQLSNDEVGELAEVFNGMQKNLKEQVSQMRSAVENLNSSGVQILAAAQQQAASTREQAATVQEVTSTMQELSQSGTDISDKARRVASASEASSSAANAGIDSVKKTNLAMDSVRQQVEELAENIVALSEKTQAVGEITASVNDVAEQSKLLALNAAIEAASAHENGSRFSVVASEMKNLADQAKESTSRVRSLLDHIQKGINTSVMLTEEAVKRVETGKTQAGISQQTIKQLADSTEESVQAFQQIIGGTNQQQIGFDQVTQGMQDIRQASEQTAASTSQLEGAVSNLNALSRQLNTLIERYRV